LDVVKKKTRRRNQETHKQTGGDSGYRVPSGSIGKRTKKGNRRETIKRRGQCTTCNKKKRGDPKTTPMNLVEIKTLAPDVERKKKIVMKDIKSKKSLWESGRESMGPMGVGLKGGNRPLEYKREGGREEKERPYRYM